MIIRFKIIHIITSLDDGGAEAILYRTCKNLKDHQQKVISLKGKGKYGDLIEKEGIDVICIKPFNILHLFYVLFQNKPNVVQTWLYHANLIGGLVAKLVGIKKIFWGIHNSSLIPGISKYSTILLSSLSAKFSSWIPYKIIVVSKKAIKFHLDIGFEKNKMVYIPNGYDLEEFKPNIIHRNFFRREIGIEENEFLIGLVGRYDSIKDHNSFFKALSEIEKLKINISAVLVGKGITKSNKEISQDLIQQNIKSKVCLLGSRNDIPKIMNGIDILVLPSISEAFPNVINEAMACGTPCIVTDVGDSSLIVGDTGWIVPPKTPFQLAKAIAEAESEFRIKPKWERRQFLCRERIQKNFSIDKMIKNYIAVWNET